MSPEFEETRTEYKRKLQSSNILIAAEQRHLCRNADLGRIPKPQSGDIFSVRE